MVMVSPTWSVPGHVRFCHALLFRQRDEALALGRVDACCHILVAVRIFMERVHQWQVEVLGPFFYKYYKCSGRSYVVPSASYTEHPEIEIQVPRYLGDTIQVTDSVPLHQTPCPYCGLHCYRYIAPRDTRPGRDSKGERDKDRSLSGLLARLFLCAYR